MPAIASKRKAKPGPIKIDIGCGSRKYRGPEPDKKPEDDWVGIDQIAFPGVDHVFNAGTDVWPFADGSVARAYSCHFLEHLDAIERIHCFNELWRVLVPDGECQLVVPHWSSCRAYGDPTHKWPPLGEFAFYYLDPKWRETQAPHTDIAHWPLGYKCNFDAVISPGLNSEVLKRNQEFIAMAMAHFKEAVFDLHVTLTKKA